MASSELQYIFEERSVPSELQTAIITAGYGSTSLFAAFAETRETLRKQLESDFDLSPFAEGISDAVARERRLNCARLIDAWQ
eukprot:2210545-Amphidinium_carterae.1